MRRNKSLDKTTAANLGLKPIYSYFASESGSAPLSRSKEIALMTGGYETVALTVAYEAISSRLKTLLNKANAATEC
jgi:hypothetical protein